MIKFKRIILTDGTTKLERISNISINYNIEEKIKKYKEKYEKQNEYIKHIIELLPENSNKNLIKRFFIKVDIKNENECWNWIGSTCNDGYGNFLYNGKVVGAHRISYIIYYGDIPKDKIIMHKCNNPRCVNINHLKLGTHKENTEQKIKEGRDAIVSGENNPNSKLTWIKVNEIREKYYRYGIKMIKLANEYNISEGTIHQIIHNRTWIDNNYKPLLIIKKRNNEIREKYSKNKIKMIDLGKEFNMNRHDISYIIRNME